MIHTKATTTFILLALYSISLLLIVRLGLCLRKGQGTGILFIFSQVPGLCLRKGKGAGTPDNKINTAGPRCTAVLTTVYPLRVQRRLRDTLACGYGGIRPRLLAYALGGEAPGPSSSRFTHRFSTSARLSVALLRVYSSPSSPFAVTMLLSIFPTKG
jgi:hypothetical protein